MARPSGFSVGFGGWFPELVGSLSLSKGSGDVGEWSLSWAGVGSGSGSGGAIGWCDVVDGAVVGWLDVPPGVFCGWWSSDEDGAFGGDFVFVAEG